jgi:hypothetical protein
MFIRWSSAASGERALSNQLFHEYRRLLEGIAEHELHRAHHLQVEADQRVQRR